MFIMFIMFKTKSFKSLGPQVHANKLVYITVDLSKVKFERSFHQLICKCLRILFLRVFFK